MTYNFIKCVVFPFNLTKELHHCFGWTLWVYPPSAATCSRLKWCLVSVIFFSYLLYWRTSQPELCFVVVIVEIRSIKFIISHMSETVQSVDMRGTVLTEWLLFFSAVLLQCSLSPLSLNAVCSLCSARCFNQGSCGAETAVFSSSCRRFRLISSLPALPCCLPLSLAVSHFILTPLWGFPHSSLSRFPHEFFSLLKF